MNLLKQSTARNIVVFMTDATDNITGKTGLTLTITASKNGAAFASITPTVTELSNGFYSLALTSSHTDTLGDLALYITGTGADPVGMIGQVVLGLPGDSTADVAAIKAKTDNLPSDPADASDIAASFVTVNSKLDAIDDYVDTEVAAIKAKTDNLPSDPADASDIAAAFATVNSTLSTLGGYIDTEVAAILAAVDTEVAAIKAQTDQLAFSGGGVSAHLLAGQISIKKNQALAGFEFPMTDDTDHDPATGLTVTVQRSIDGGAFAAATNSAAEVSAGIYKLDLSAADLNGNVITLKFTAAGADTRFATIFTQA
jgi:hypothetical protein